jgi:RNA polymerase sigma-70 factor, ECF subfamily
LHGFPINIISEIREIYGGFSDESKNNVILFIPISVNSVMKAALTVPIGDKIEANSAIADFEAWMAQEQRRIYLLCLRFLQNGDEADSAVQDVFVKAFQIMHRSDRIIREPEKWLTRVAVNACMDRLNSKRWIFWRRRIDRDDEKILLQFVPSPGMNQEEALIESEKMRKLRQALKRLSARQRLIFIMRHDEGRSFDEIGDILGLDIGTVKSHMARAVSKLREELRDLYA